MDQPTRTESLQRDSPRARSLSSQAEAPGVAISLNSFGRVATLTAVVMSSAVGLCACGEDVSYSVNYRLIGVAEPGPDGRCPESTEPQAVVPAATSFRLTYLSSTDGTLVCDALLETDGPAPRIAVPAIPGVLLDVAVEAFAPGAEGPEVIASGRATAVDLAQVGELEILLAPTGLMACSPRRTSAARAFHSVTVLPDGSVLLIGGITRIEGGSWFATESVELFDGVEFVPLAVENLAARVMHGAVVLDGSGPDEIRIAVIGGITVTGDPAAEPALQATADGLPFPLVPSTAALAAPAQVLAFDPKTRSLTAAPAESSAVTPRLFAAVTADRGLAAVAGGWAQADRAAPVGTVETIDTATGGPGTRVNLLTPRLGATMNVTAAGELLIWGGHLEADDLRRTALNGELIDLSTGQASEINFVAPTSTGAPRAFHSAARTGAGDLLFAGGFTVTLQAANQPEPQFIDRLRLGPDSFVTPLAPPAGAVGAGFPEATALANGDVLVSGGNPIVSTCPGEVDPLVCSSPDVYRYEMQTELLSPLPNLNVSRYGHRGAVLPGGAVLLTGGVHALAGMLAPLAEAEIFNPNPADYDPLTEQGMARDPGEELMPCRRL
jgi:hypothetical protein